MITAVFLPLLSKTYLIRVIPKFSFDKKCIEFPGGGQHPAKNVSAQQDLFTSSSPRRSFRHSKAPCIRERTRGALVACTNPPIKGRSRLELSNPREGVGNYRIPDGHRFEGSVGRDLDKIRCRTRHRMPSKHRICFCDFRTVAGGFEQRCPKRSLTSHSCRLHCPQQPIPLRECCR